jgi:xanthine dehydrogenase YagT iron-sulfur-binding subunit
MPNSDNSAAKRPRRGFLRASTPTREQAAPGEVAVTERPRPRKAVETVSVTLRVNGIMRHLTLDPRTTLLDAIRDYLDLPGTKKGCVMGA